LWARVRFTRSRRRLTTSTEESSPMRKRLTIAISGAVAMAVVTAACAVAAVGPAADGNTQEATISFKPTKLGKKTSTPVTLSVTTKTGTVSEPLGKPVPVTQAIIDFDKGATVF